jgi:hypothetical protein
MRSATCGWLLLLITVGGCAGAAPPFDELPLRDTLRAEPEVVAALPGDARARLATRFQTAAARDTAADAVESAPSVARVAAQVDLARQNRSADALVIGVVGGGAAQALPAGTQVTAANPLPPLAGAPPTSTAQLEARALNGTAGASLRELVAAAHAQRLERVVGLPIAAVAVGDTVYVNGAWLVAMAPLSGDGGFADGAQCEAACDGGTPTGAQGAGARSGTGGAGGRGGATGGRGGAGGRPPLYTGTGGVIEWPPPDLTGPYSPPSTSNPSTDDLNDAAEAADGCAALADACASADDGSDDSCSGQDDGSQSDCSAPADDGGSDGGGDCRTAPGRGHTSVPTTLWMFAPLAYLLGRNPGRRRKR